MAHRILNFKKLKNAEGEIFSDYIRTSEGSGAKKSHKCDEVSSKRKSDKRFSSSGFFHESVSPEPLSIPLGPFFEFGRKFAEIRNFVFTSITFEHLREFLQSEMAYMRYSGSWGKQIDEKSLKSKISCQTPFIHVLNQAMFGHVY